MSSDRYSLADMIGWSFQTTGMEPPRCKRGRGCVATFAPAMRAISHFLLFHFLVATLAPAWIVADFLLERGRIERDLCVQRMVPDAMRTCHGECQLKKRLEQSNERQQNLPAELQAFRLGEMLPTQGRPVPYFPAEARSLSWSVLEEGTLEGHPRPIAPVPWC